MTEEDVPLEILECGEVALANVAWVPLLFFDHDILRILDSALAQVP
jgi:hypothetical protein